MKLYRTREDNIINLENITMIYRDPETDLYVVSTVDGKMYQMPEIEKDDIERIMEYNDFLI